MTEWYVVCARPGCEEVKAVKSRAQQRKQKHCSRRCAGMQREFTKAERLRGAAKSATVRRAAAMKALEGLTKIQIARVYYMRGWHQGKRSARRAA